MPKRKRNRRSQTNSSKKKSSSKALEDEMDAVKKTLSEKEFSLFQKLLQDSDAAITELKQESQGLEAIVTNSADVNSNSDGTDINAGGETAQDKQLNYSEFISYILEALKKDNHWESVESITVDARSFFSPNTSSQDWSPERLIHKTDILSIGGNTIQISFKTDQFKVKGTAVDDVVFKRIEYTKYHADLKLHRIVGNKDAFSEFCKKKLLPLVNTNDDGVITAQRGYVEVDGTNAFEDFDINFQIDKSFALVVAGESGSGKSVFSCLESMEHGYIPLYMLLRLRKGEKENKGENKKNTTVDVSDIYKEKPPNKFEHSHEFLREILVGIKDEKGNHVTAICDLKDKLNGSRNEWASKLLEKAVDNFCEADTNARSWHEGSWSKEALPDKVALILDEATDLDLVEGLIATVRETYANMKNLVKKHVILVLAGTGLDLIRYGNRVGTNPAYSRLIRMKGPNLKHLVDNNVVSPEVSQAVSEGMFSRVLQSNSRMLFRGILPVLQLPIHKLDGGLDPLRKKQRYEERLKAIASFGPLMDYAVRLWVNQNTIGELSSKQRDELLMDAFVYHLSAAIKSSLESTTSHKTVKTNNKTELEKVKGLRNTTQHGRDIFEVGLAAQSGTSAALKYMSCFGLTCPVRPSFGNELEELTALHYQRLMEVQGYRSRRVTLRYAWPPMSNKRSEKIDEKAIKHLKKKLEEQSKTELSTLSLGIGTGRECTIFSQGTASAQGGDVLVLRFDNEKRTGELVTIQCKHYKDTTNMKRNEIESWWASLGISLEDKNFSPKTGKAGYSYTGLEALRALLEERIRRNCNDATISLGDRIIACSFKTPDSAEFPIPDGKSPDGKSARVWFREMLEPTISTFQLREAVDGLEEI